MFYDETKTISACDDDPTLVFEAIKLELKELVDKILSRKTFDYNVVDENGNDVMMRLLKKGYYDVVLNHMNDKRWNVNHQNNNGDTFAHILVSMDYSKVVEIIKTLLKNKEFKPNIRNNEGETILDKSINNAYIYTTTKILSDHRFNSIGIFSFKKLYDTYVKSNNFGRYTRINNLEMILDNLEDKEVAPQVKEIIEKLKNNLGIIKEEVLKNNRTDSMDLIVNTAIAG
jgi:ankyrin repeat protein